jgi:hypothetical protein
MHPFINANTTKQQAIQLLRDIWTAGNDADKVRWQLQLDKDEAALVEQRRLQTQSNNLVAQTKVEEAEAARKDELKKNKSKYLPILDRDVPSISPVIVFSYMVRKMEKGLFFELWYYINAGLDEALHNSNLVNDKAMVMLQLPNGSTSWVPAASARTASGVINNKNILWEDFCQAAPHMIIAMEEAGWPQDHVAMVSKILG